MKKQIKKAKIYINNNKYLNNKKYIYPIISFLLFIIIAMLTYFWIQKYSENKIIEQVTEVNTILNSNEYSKQNCEKILNFDKTEVVKYLEKNWNETNSIFNKKIFDDFNLICDKVFNISWCVKWVKPAVQKYHTRVVIIDFWWDDDPIGLIVYNINNMFIEHSELIKWLDVYEQLALVWRWRKKYKNVYTIWDGTWFWRLARAADINCVIDYYITFSSWPSWKYNKDKWYYAVDKSYMVDLTKWYFNRMMITFLNTEWDLMDHIKDFRKITDNSAKVQQYEAKRWKHDDLVACLLMLSAFLTEWIWLVEPEQFTNYWIDMTDNLDYQFDLSNNEGDILYHNRLY